MPSAAEMLANIASLQTKIAQALVMRGIEPEEATVLSTQGEFKALVANGQAMVWLCGRYWLDTDTEIAQLADHLAKELGVAAPEESPAPAIVDHQLAGEISEAIDNVFAERAV